MKKLYKLHKFINCYLNDKKFREYFDSFNASDEVTNKYIHSVGNLTLLNGKKNIEASNNPFEEKIKIYQNKGKYNQKKRKNYIFPYHPKNWS